MFRRVLAFGVVWVVASGAYGDIYIDLRPDHPGPYSPSEAVNVEAWFVDDGTGHPITHEDILFRGYQLDFEATDTALGLPPEMDMEAPGGIQVVFDRLPRPSWIYPLPSESPLFQMILTPGGEMLIGNVDLTVNGSGWLDVMNPGENINLGAWTVFGFGLEDDDPVTKWRAYTGELTGGRLFMEVPEPASVVLLAIGVVAGMRRRRGA